MWLKSIRLDCDDQEILDSLMRQLEFPSRDEETAKKIIAGDAIKNSYVPMIMRMPSFDYDGASFLAA